ncbi:TcdA/TcdB catalytic glycosyltransferase domain-containing protein [Xenorhabdus littoralis]|uniref:TcdA/TcdB catalytic glycosyltransferase domain-containing protein n=1 Tax=Xenorhabdus littoralis TaxID=2582835 RepID=UPI0029E7F422|nr:TcdA/TcdB catalytic glycosyltransferase domain-containing protein [Xenorhabdus sp. psl]MDX7991876.1 hypothetical protein [Xenorhabdus sp. psl]
MTIPKKIHYVWIGRDILPSDLLNILKVKEINPDYEINIWTMRESSVTNTVDNTVNSIFDETRCCGEIAFNHKNGVRFRSIKEAFLDLEGSLRGKIKFPDGINIPTIPSVGVGNYLYSIYLRQSNGIYYNYASASDIARLAILYYEGGIYLDVDVKFKTDKRLEHNINELTDLAFGDDSGTGWGTNSFNSSIIGAPKKSSKLEKLLIRISSEIALYDSVKHKPAEKMSSTWVFWRVISPLGRISQTKSLTGPSACALFLFGKTAMTNEPIPTEFRLEKENRSIFQKVNCDGDFGKLPNKYYEYESDHGKYVSDINFSYVLTEQKSRNANQYPHRIYELRLLKGYERENKIILMPNEWHYPINREI